MHYQVSRNGSVLGSYDRATMDALLRSGILQPTDFYWCEGFVGGRPLSDLIGELEAEEVQKRSTARKCIFLLTLATLAIVGAAIPIALRIGHAPQPDAANATPSLSSENGAPVPASQPATAPHAQPEINPKELLDKAKNGDSDSLRLLQVIADADTNPQWREAAKLCGEWLLDKSNPKVNAALGIWYLGRVAEAGDEELQSRLARMFNMGEEVPRDNAEAVKWWKRLAEKGDTNAMCSIGCAYASGDGVPENPPEGVKWIRKAADKGDVMGKFHSRPTGIRVEG